MCKDTSSGDFAIEFARRFAQAWDECPVSEDEVEAFLEAGKESELVRLK